MVFVPGFPAVWLNGTIVQVVEHFKYLNNIVTRDVRDDRDIERREGQCRFGVR